MSQISFSVCTHNMTEGSLQDGIKNISLFAGQEIVEAKVRAGFGDNYQFYFPNDPHQCLAWNTDTWMRDGEPRSTFFHGNGGSSNPDVPSSIATPARFMHEQPLKHRKSGAQITLMTTWLINSWTAHPGPTEADRKRLALLSLDKIDTRVQANRKNGRQVVLMGDFNSAQYNIQFDGMKGEPGNRIDRIFIGKGGTIANLRHGPRTGVGGDLYHQSMFANLTINYRPPKPPKPDPDNTQPNDPETVEKTKLITVMHARFDRQLEQVKFAEDMDYIVKQEPDVVCVTGVDQRENEFLVAARARDYVPALTQGGTKIMVSGKKRVSIGGQSAKLMGREDYKRYMVSTLVKFWGARVWVTTTDLLSPGKTKDSREAYKKQLDALGAEVRKRAKGDLFSLWTMDVHDADYPRVAMRNNRLLNIWDEEHVRPTSELGLGRYQGIVKTEANKGDDNNSAADKGKGGDDDDNPPPSKPKIVKDQGVMLKSYKVHPQQNSTERFVSATFRLNYEVAKKDPTTGTNPDTDQDDTFLSSGDISWADYQDGELYDLPYAIDSTE